MVSSGLAREALDKWARARDLKPFMHVKTGVDRGLNLVGYFRTVKGIGEAARSSVLALSTVHIPFSVVDFEYGIPKEQQVLAVPEGGGKTGFAFSTSVFHINPPQLPYAWWNYKRRDLVGRYGIGVWYWELPEIPKEWFSAFRLVDEVWVATQFVFDGVYPKSPVPVIKIPPCIQIAIDDNLDRSHFGLPEDSFLFMCAYDVFSVQERKNPQGAIRAFKKAFRREDSSVGMVVKVNNAAANSAEVRKLREEVAGWSNFYIIEDVFDKRKFNSLLNLVDSFVSLHRSEGFGLIPAEAMYLGKPVIMTRWSGNVDFITDDNSCGVDFRLVPIHSNAGPYQPGQFWAEPDEEQASDFMHRLRFDAEYTLRLAEQARLTIREKYSPETIGNLMRNRLQEIGLL